MKMKKGERKKKKKKRKSRFCLSEEGALSAGKATEGER